MIDLNDEQTRRNLIDDIIHDNGGEGITNFICTLVAESLGRINFSPLDLLLLQYHLSALIKYRSKDESQS